MRSVEVREWVRVNKECHVIWKTGEMHISTKRSSDSDPVLLTRSTHEVTAAVGVIIIVIIEIFALYQLLFSGMWMWCNRIVDGGEMDEKEER